MGDRWQAGGRGGWIGSLKYPFTGRGGTWPLIGVEANMHTLDKGKPLTASYEVVTIT